jgi:hypothetical protein
MNLSNAIEGGIAGASTLTLIREALSSIDRDQSKPRLLHKPGIIKKIKKESKRKNGNPAKLYITLAGELLSSAAYFGLTGLGKKRNAVLRGGLLGAAAGIAAAYLQQPETTEEEQNSDIGLKRKLATVSLYTAGGLLAGVAVKHLNKPKLKKIKKYFKNQ